MPPVPSPEPGGFVWVGHATNKHLKKKKKKKISCPLWLRARLKVEITGNRYLSFDPGSKWTRFLLAKIKVYVLHIWTQPAWGVMGPYAWAYCFFANLGKKFRIRPKGSPCPSVGSYITGCTACMNAKKKHEYSRNQIGDPNAWVQ